MRIPKYKAVYLYLTHACGAKCSYCYRQGFYDRNDVYGGACGPIKMTEKVALDAVEYCLTNLDVDDTISFFFWGGEPFLNYKVMKKVVETYPQFEYHTNTEGRAVTQEMSDFIKDFGHLGVTWSLGNAYEKYGSLQGKVEKEKPIAEAIRHLKLRGGVNLVLQNYKNMCEDFKYIADNLTHQITVDFATKQERTDEQMKDFEESYYQLLKTYMGKGSKFSGLNPLYNSNQWLEKFGPTEKIRRYRFCNTGLERLFIDTQGGIWQCDNMYVCQHNQLGSIYDGIDYSKLDYVYEIKDNIDEKMSQHCEGCEANGYCPRNKCLGYNLEWTGDMFKPDITFCLMCRAIYRVINKLMQDELQGETQCQQEK